MIKVPEPGANIVTHNILFSMGKEGVAKQREIAREIVTELRNLCQEKRLSIISNIKTVQSRIRNNMS